jgi:Fe-S-cluster containining protein
VSASRDPPAAPPAAALRGLAELYRDLDAELAAIAPRCELSGRCCDFRTSGHTLFATDLELAHLAATRPLRADGDPELCPWWVGGRCDAREGRPLGCRLYFCDPARQAELQELSLRFHDRLKRLHDATGAPYRYERFVRRVRELAVRRMPR